MVLKRPTLTSERLTAQLLPYLRGDSNTQCTCDPDITELPRYKSTSKPSPPLVSTLGEQDTNEDYHHRHVERDDYADFDEDQFNFDKLPDRDKEVLETEFNLNLSVHELDKSLQEGGAQENPQNSDEGFELIRSLV